MATEYLIKQSVSTVHQRWLKTIFKTEYERVAVNSYNNYVKEYPEKYFELVKVETNEVCMMFTPFKD